MTDCIRIENGRAAEIWRNTSKAALCFRVHDGETEPRAVFAPAIVAAIVEAESGAVQEGQAWNGAGFDPLPEAPPAPRRMVRKSVIIARLIAADKIGAAKVALDSDPSAYARWWAPDKPSIYADDAEALGLLNAIGADPAVILAPE